MASCGGGGVLSASVDKTSRPKASHENDIYFVVMQQQVTSQTPKGIEAAITEHLTRGGSTDFSVQLVCFPQALRLFDDALGAFSSHPRCLVRVRWGAAPPSIKDRRKLHENQVWGRYHFQLYQPHFFAIQALLDRSRLSLKSRTKDLGPRMWDGIS
jgi:hypothetical protein